MSWSFQRFRSLEPARAAWFLGLLVGCGNLAAGVELDAAVGPDAPVAHADGGAGAGPPDVGPDAGPAELDCRTGEACSGDRRCDGARCVPFVAGEHDEGCLYGRPRVLSPAVQCAWTGPPRGDAFPDHRNVLATVMVADFDGDRATHRPSLVFASYDGDDGDMPACGVDPTGATSGVLRVIDGATCAQQATISVPRVVPSAPVAIGDLDGDGRPDVVAYTLGGGLAAWRAHGSAFSLLWHLDGSALPEEITTWAGECHWNGPSLHDLDDDGVPEVIADGLVISADGKLVDASAARAPADIGAAEYDTTGLVPVVADLDGDGQPELTDGASLWSFDRTTRRFVLRGSGLGPRGQVAIADLGTFGPAGGAAARDGIPEIVVVAHHEVRALDLDGRVVFGPVPLPWSAPPSFGGPPTVGDFDGDGRPEIAVASRGAFSVFDLDCDGTASPDRCATGRADGLLWSRPSRDVTSSVTGSAVFDFHGDGTAEAVYADECFTRVYDGVTGDVLYSEHRTSCTWYENPVIADTDGDGRSELVIGMNANTAGCDLRCPELDPIFEGLRCLEPGDCPPELRCVRGRCRCTDDAQCGEHSRCVDPPAGPSADGRVCRAAHPAALLQGVRVLRDRLDRWPPSRMIWNQHAYAVTNIDEDGHVPRTSSWRRNWLEPSLDNFRQNVQGSLPPPTALPDATVGGIELACPRDGSPLVLSASACNRGMADLAAGTPVLFHEQGRVDRVACAAPTSRVLEPGACERVACTWLPSELNRAVPMRATIDVGGVQPIVECHEGNNGSELVAVRCDDPPG